MSRKRDFYASLPRMTDPILDTLLDVIAQEELAHYQALLAELPRLRRTFRVVDVQPRPIVVE